MSQAIVFASTCPRCERAQVQDTFTVADLMTLLYGGYPIEAYCAICDEFWPVSIKERVELGDMVAEACEGRSLLTEGNFLPQRPHE